MFPKSFDLHPQEAAPALVPVNELALVCCAALLPPTPAPATLATILVSSCLRLARWRRRGRESGPNSRARMWCAGRLRCSKKPCRRPAPASGILRGRRQQPAALWRTACDENRGSLFSLRRGRSKVSAGMAEDTLSCRRERGGAAHDAGKTRH